MVLGSFLAKATSLSDVNTCARSEKKVEMKSKRISIPASDTLNNVCHIKINITYSRCNLLSCTLTSASDVILSC